MRRTGIVAGMSSLVLLGAMAATWVQAGDEPLLPAPTRIRVIEHATTDKVIDIGRNGDSTGDLLTFQNDVYNEANTRIVGSDQGTCVRQDPGSGTWECAWTTFLKDGNVMVQGPFYDGREISRLAVVGGTGMYRNARGVMELRVRHGGTEFAFVFDLIP